MRKPFGRRLFWPALLLAPLGAAGAESPDLGIQRLVFEVADQALQNGAAVPLEALADYPLYPYLLYRDLTRRLTHHPAQEIDAFLTAYGDSPLAPRLRAAWLEQLAQEQRWDEFLRIYQPGHGTALECRYRQALLYRGRRDQVLHGIDRLWLSGEALPDACDPLFALWKDQGGLTPERIWRRLALALEQGQPALARYLQDLLPGGERATAALWLKVDGNPRLILEPGLIDPSHPRAADIVLHGLERWSRQDSVTAANALDILKTRYPLPPERLIPLERRIALFMAGRAHPDALARLIALPETAVDTPVREWRVRSGLKRGDWNATLAWLERLTAEESAAARWQYWRARALEAVGRADEARGIYQRLAEQRDYHGFLAADRLGVGYRLGHRPLPLSAQDLAAIEQIAGIQRARELYRLDRLGQARTEWQGVTQFLDQEDLTKAAALAHGWGWHYQAIVTLAKAGYWDDLELRFPLPYRDIVLARARHQDLDPAWVYAVMRQESAFRFDAVSSAGAVGLMQVLPATGQRVAWDRRLSPPSGADLLAIDTNIRYGTYYLRHTLDRFQNHPVLATAAYNAGPQRVLQWLPAREPLEADRWAETIPFAETRQYVQRVMEYSVVYAERLGLAGYCLTERMKPIPAAVSNDPR